jgi:predicted DNA-binding transcriptional regulator AlpA
LGQRFLIQKDFALLIVRYLAQSCTMNAPSDLINLTEAREMLGISHTTMARLVRDEVVQHFPNLINRREKLVSKAEVLALKPKRAEAA